MSWKKNPKFENKFYIQRRYLTNKISFYFKMCLSNIIIILGYIVPVIYLKHELFKLPQEILHYLC